MHDLFNFNKLRVKVEIENENKTRVAGTVQLILITIENCSNKDEMKKRKESKHKRIYKRKIRVETL